MARCSWVGVVSLSSSFRYIMFLLYRLVHEPLVARLDLEIRIFEDPEASSLPFTTVEGDNTLVVVRWAGTYLVEQWEIMLIRRKLDLF
mgnify:CR=1 FL=1